MALSQSMLGQDMASITANKKATVAAAQSTLCPDAILAAWQTGLQTQN